MYLYRRNEPAMTQPILSVQNLTTVFDTSEGRAVAVNNVSFSISRGETLGIVGESGCGKSVTAYSIIRLLQTPGRIAAGQIFFNGEDLMDKSDEEMRAIRGNGISMIFQEPMTSLNPVFQVGRQITEVLMHHKDMRKEDAYNSAVEMLTRVGLAAPEWVMNAYPHELSGGMRQRALIAMSLVCNPDLLIADEPTTALDVTVQVQILKLLNELKNDFGMAVLLITHDLGIVAESCDRVAVMYASNIVETGALDHIFHQPSHPYTIGLMQAIPAAHQPKELLRIIPGQVPRPVHYPIGCNFQSRCFKASEKCTFHEPELEPVRDDHDVACWNWQKQWTPFAERIDT
jgi:peptide/nickel transport system ATP-binding protein